MSCKITLTDLPCIIDSFKSLNVQQSCSWMFQIIPTIPIHSARNIKRVCDIFLLVDIYKYSGHFLVLEKRRNAQSK